MKSSHAADAVPTAAFDPEADMGRYPTFAAGGAHQAPQAQW
jgi:hypothetical protein